MNNKPFDDDKTFEEQLALTDGKRREKVNSLIPREKKNASLAAGVILPLALKKCGIDGSVEIGGGMWDKPRLVKPDGVCYNLSHSGDYTLLALSDNEVGVDIERIKPVDLRLAEKFFTKKEWEAIEGAGGGALRLFYRTWVIKEAYLKALGVGLNRPLNSFEVRFTAGGAKIEDPLCGEAWLVSETDGFEGYAAACCAKEYAPDGEAEELKI